MTTTTETVLQESRFSYYNDAGETEVITLRMVHTRSDMYDVLICNGTGTTSEKIGSVFNRQLAAQIYMIKAVDLVNAHYNKYYVNNI